MDLTRGQLGLRSIPGRMTRATEPPDIQRTGVVVMGRRDEADLAARTARRRADQGALLDGSIHGRRRPHHDLQFLGMIGFPRGTRLRHRRADRIGVRQAVLGHPRCGFRPMGPMIGGPARIVAGLAATLTPGLFPSASREVGNGLRDVAGWAKARGILIGHRDPRSRGVIPPAGRTARGLSAAGILP